MTAAAAYKNQQTSNPYIPATTPSLKDFVPNITRQKTQILPQISKLSYTIKMNRCEHGFNCANADCQVMFHNMALSRGPAPNLQPPQPGGGPPGYAPQQRPAPGPSQQYGPSQPIPIPQRPTQSPWPVNKYYPPNSYIQYAQPFVATLPGGLPPSIGNPAHSLPPSFPAPMPVQGPPASMPFGAPHPSNQQASFQTASSAWCIPYNGRYSDFPSGMRGAGCDYVPQEVEDDEDFEYDAEDDGDGCLHCRRHCPTTRNKWSVDEDDWLHRLGDARSEEDLREAGPVSGFSDYAIFYIEPGSTDKQRSHRSEGAGAQSSAAPYLAKPERKRQTLHRYFPRQDSRSQVSASKATSAGKKRTLSENSGIATGPANPTNRSHDHASSQVDQTSVSQLRGRRFDEQQAPDPKIRTTEEIKSDGIPPISSDQPPTSKRLLWLTGQGQLFHMVIHRLGDSLQRSFDASGPTDKRSINYVYAHEDQISHTVLEELGIPLRYFDDSHRLVIKTDCNDKLLLELLERTQIKRNYAGKCSENCVRSNDPLRKGDFVPGRIGSENSSAAVLEPIQTDSTGLRGGSGDSPARGEPTGLLSESALLRASLVHNPDRVGRSTSNIDSVTSTTTPPEPNLLFVYTAQRLVPSGQHEQQKTDPGRLIADPRLSGETPMSYAMALRLNMDTPEYFQPYVHQQPAQSAESPGYQRLLHESRRSRPEISHHTRPLPWHLQSNWRPNQIEQTSPVERSNSVRHFNADAPQARRLILTSGFLQDEAGHTFSLDSLDQTPYPYYLHVHDTLIAPYFLRELDIPHHWHPSDHRFLNITESLSREMIHILTLRTSLESFTQPDLVNAEAAQRRRVRHVEDARFIPEQNRPHAGHLRGGARSPSDNESLSSLSPRRQPGETAYGYERRSAQAIAEQRHHAHISMDDNEDEHDTRLLVSPTTGGPAESAHERNRRRLQRDMETRSQLRADTDRARESEQSTETLSRRRANEDLQRERQRILDPELEPPRGSLRDIRRNAIDFGTPDFRLQGQKAPWVRDQEAAQNRRSVSRGRARRRLDLDFVNGLTNGYGDSPHREHGPNGDTGRPRGGSGADRRVSHRGGLEITLYAMQPNGQEVNLQDVAWFNLQLWPSWGWLNVRRNGEGNGLVLRWMAD